MKITKGALPLMLGSYAQNYNINLFMKGCFAYTNGNSIVIPRLHLNDHESLEMAYGYVAHECGHIRYSNFELFDSVAEDRLTHTLFNAIEDPRIELLQTKDWPGLKNTFNFLVEKLKKLSLSCLRRNQKIDNGDCTALLMLFCNYYLRYFEAEQEAAKELYTTARKFLSQKIGNIAVQKLEELLNGTTALKNSAEVLAVAKKILVFINQIGALNVSDNMPFPTDVRMSAATQDEQDDSAENKPQTQGKAKSVASSSLNSNQSEEKVLAKIKAEYAKQPKKFIDIHLCSDSTENLALINFGVREYLSDMSDDVEIEEEFGMMQGGTATPRENSTLLQRVKQDPNLTMKIRELVQGHDIWRCGFATHGDYIDCQRYHQFKKRTILDNRVFYKNVPHRTMNTNIHLLVDASGSMYTRCGVEGKYRFDIANEVALSLALACEGQKHLVSEVTYFPGQINEFETVTRPYESAYAKAAYFDQRPKGGTPMAQALMHAIYGFTQGPGKRNIVILITDGDPDNPEAVADLLKESPKQGVEVYAIRIGQNFRCQNLYPMVRTINDCSELPDALCSMLNQTLYHANEPKAA